MDTLDDFAWHGQCSDGDAIQDTTRGQTAEINIALNVSSGAEIPCIYSARVRGTMLLSCCIAHVFARSRQNQTCSGDQSLSHDQ